MISQFCNQCLTYIPIGMIYYNTNTICLIVKCLIKTYLKVLYYPPSMMSKQLGWPQSIMTKEPFEYLGCLPIWAKTYINWRLWWTSLLLLLTYYFHCIHAQTCIYYLSDNYIIIYCYLWSWFVSEIKCYLLSQTFFKFKGIIPLLNGRKLDR